MPKRRTADRADRRGRGGLEREVIAALAAGATPMTPRQVQAQLRVNLAYTTVMTTLSRLCEKGALLRTRRGRAYAYSLASEPEAVPAALAARQMRRLLGSGAERAGVLRRFVAELDPEEEKLLAQTLAQSQAPPEPQVRLEQR